MRYNAAIASRYRQSIQAMIYAMAVETQREIIKLFKSKTAKEFFTHDASFSSDVKKLSDRLKAKFSAIFDNKAVKLAEKVVKQSDNVSKRELKKSIEQLAGQVTLKTNFIPRGVKEVSKVLISENVALIKTIPERYFTNITGAVVRSITSGTGVKGLLSVMEKYYGEATRKAKNVALDQTRKAYNSINKQRMQAAGYTEFEWLHSGGGQKPRKDHIKMSGNIYSFDKLPVIDKRTGERGIPGQAINCGCTMRPVYKFED